MELVAIILQGKICKVGELDKLAPAPSILQKSTKGSRLSAQLFSDCRLFFVDCGFGDNPRVGPQTIFNPKKSSADNSIGVCWENRTTLPRTHKVIIPLSCLGLFFNKLTPAPGPLSLLGSFELRSSVVSVLPSVTIGTSLSKGFLCYPYFWTEECIPDLFGSLHGFPRYCSTSEREPNLHTICVSLILIFCPNIRLILTPNSSCDKVVTFCTHASYTLLELSYPSFTTY